MAQRHRESVAFLTVYIREVHAADEWQFEEDDGIIRINQPRAWAERAQVAAMCRGRLLPSIPMVVDTMDDRTSRAYSASPDRLYLIGQDGRVIYKSGRGPFGFLPGELEQALIMHLIDRRR